MGLKASSHRGFLNVFQSFARKTPLSNLIRHDEFGLSLIHYASIFNRFFIITNLIMLGADSNLKQQIKYATIGPMGVHYASRCGSLDALSCLLSNYGNISYYDNNGWVKIILNKLIMSNIIIFVINHSCLFTTRLTLISHVWSVCLSAGRRNCWTWPPNLSMAARNLPCL